MKEIKIEVAEFHSFNTFSELEEFIVNDFLGEKVADFQGDIIEIENVSITVTSESVIVPSPKHKGVAWVVTDSPRSGWFRLSCIKGCAQPDEMLTATLPEYVKQEAIATLKGEW